MSLLKVWNGIEWVSTLGPSGIIGPQGPQGIQGIQGSGIETIVNLGAGEGVFAQLSSSQAEFKSLIGGSGIDLSSNSTEITIDFDITEVTELNDLLAGTFYRKDENLVPDTDEAYTIGNTTTQFNGIYAASGLFLGLNNRAGKMVVSGPDSGLECSVIERGSPTAFPALVLRGGRAVVIETSNLGTYSSGYYMGPSQQILMGDIEDYSLKTGSMIYASELNNFKKKITSILNNSTVDPTTDNVGHYVFHRYTTNSNPGVAQIALEAQVQARTLAAISNSCTAIKATATSQQSAAHTLPAGTYTALDARVIHSGAGQINSAKAGFFGITSVGRIDSAICVHIASPSGGQTRSLSLLCEGSADFSRDVNIGDTLDVNALATVDSLSVLFDATVAGDLTVETDCDLQGSVSIGIDLEVTGATILQGDAIASGCFTTKIRNDASKRETLGLFSNVSFDRNILYLDGSAGAGIWTIVNPGKNGQTTKVIVANNAAGNFNLIFGYGGGIRWKGGVHPTMAVANSYDIFTFLYDATDDVLYGDFSQAFI